MGFEAVRASDPYFLYLGHIGRSPLGPRFHIISVLYEPSQSGFGVGGGIRGRSGLRLIFYIFGPYWAKPFTARAYITPIYFSRFKYILSLF